MTTERLSSALGDRYAIERQIGHGAMATVYLARDLKHDRNVAIKVLEPELAALLGADRFLNEISVTAHLQHPHILPLFDSGQAAGLLYYVMPYLDGESLQTRLAREKQLPVDDAVQIAIEVASALDYAHRHDVIHRDIKPGNILLHDGKAVVADFGIALAVSAAGGDRLTETGLAVGTPEYMSPEQATAARELDARSDVYSLGAVLYEMLAGEPPHGGASAQAVIAKIATDEPRPVREVRAATPIHVEHALESALAKLPADRCRSAAQFIGLLERPETAPWRRPSRAARSLRWGPPLLLAWAVAASVVAVWLAAGEPSAPTRLSRWVLALTEGRRLVATGGWWDHPVAIAADGSSIAYVAKGADAGRLYVRRVTEITPQVVTGSDGASSPFFSPDGRWLGFFADGKLRKVSLEGGLPIDITDVVGLNLGASWGTNDTIVYAEGDRGLMRVGAAGGQPELLHPFDPGSWIASPAVILDGAAALVTVRTVRGTRIGVITLPSGEISTYDDLGNAAAARYVSPGHLVFGQAGVLRAVPFDLTDLRPSGTPVVLRDSVAVADGHPLYAVSDVGLVYVPPAEGERSLIWVDRMGRSTVVSDRSTRYLRPRLSPDGRHVLVNVTGERWQDLWLLDLDRNLLEPLVPNAPPGFKTDAVWTPDGTRVTYSRLVPSGDSTAAGIVERRIDGSGEMDVLVPRENHFAHSWSPDGQHLAVYEIAADPEQQRDIWVFDRSGNGRPLFATHANERSPSFSPDGRWLAYVSDESGRDEVYVVAYPSVSGKTRISRDGGRVPEWRPDGAELFYRNGDKMMAVPTQLGAALGHGTPEVLFEADYWTEPSSTSGSHEYDVSVDGQEFLMISTPPHVRINVVLNWLEELQATPRM